MVQLLKGDGAALSAGFLASATDMQLVEQARAGEQAAFTELWRRYAAMSRRVAWRIVKNREDAEDVAQDSLLRAYLHIQGFDGRSSFSTWLTQITINSSLMVLRRQRTRREVSFDDDPDYSAWVHSQVQTQGPDPEKSVADQQMATVLRRAIVQLPAKLRRVIEIRHKHDLPVKEVAARAGISVSAAKSRLNRATHTLEESVKRGMTPTRVTPFYPVAKAEASRLHRA